MRPFNLEEYLKNPSKKIVTRGGYPATIVSTIFHQENYPVVAEVCFSNYDKKQSYSFTANSLFLDSSEDSRDLFFAPEKHEGWINVYRDRDTGKVTFGAILHTSREKAEKIGRADGYYVATAKIEWEE